MLAAKSEHTSVAKKCKLTQLSISPSIAKEPTCTLTH